MRLQRVSARFGLEAASALLTQALTISDSCHTLYDMGKKNSRRINARVPESIADKLEELLQLSDDNLSEIIVKSIENYYSAVLRERTNPSKILRQNKFIGAASGPSDLADRYKDYLDEGLSEKT